MERTRIERRLRIEELEPRIAPSGIWDYWREMGPGSATGGGISHDSGVSRHPAIAIGKDGNPIVTWCDNSTGNYEIYVARWDGASWVEFSPGSMTDGGVSKDSADSLTPRIAVGSDGNPLVAWGTDFDRDGWPDEIYLRRWNGSSWGEMGASASGGGISNTPGIRSVGPDMAIGTDGYPVVTWVEERGQEEIYVRKWNGTSWVELGGSGSGEGITPGGEYATNPSIAIGIGGMPLVAYHDGYSNHAQIFVRRWTGTTWEVVGGGSISGGGEHKVPSIATGPDGTPIVSWTAGWLPGEIYVRRWNGAAWVEVGASSASGGGISKSSGHACQSYTSVGTDGNPIVAWVDNRSGDQEIYVLRWNGASWVELGSGSASGGGISNNTGGCFARPEMAVVPQDGTPIVVWSDNSNGNYEIYVRRYVADLPNLSFSEVATVSVGGGPETLAFGDFNRDGKMDLVTANNDAGNISILRGNGDGTFTNTATISTGRWASGVAVGDVNGDNKLDIAVSNSGADNVSILIGDGNGGFSVFTTVSTGSHPERLTLADFNADGKLDMATSNDNSNNVVVHLGNGNGTFRSGTSYSVGSRPLGGIVAADFNQDYGIDIAVTNYNSNTVSVLLGNGNGSFRSAVHYTVGTSPAGLGSGDFNKDGNLDLVVVNSGSASVSLLFGNGDGTFRTQVALGTGCAAFGVAAADYNGDGNLDIAVGGSTQGGGRAYVAPGWGDGTFGGFSSFGSGVRPLGIASADLNNDGKIDLAYTDDLGGNVVKVLLNASTGGGPSTSPTGVDLLAVSDTGVSDSDNITKLDNSTQDNRLTFEVSGTVRGATVTIYADGVSIGSAIASGTTTTIVTNGTVDLGDGSRSITARQTEPGKTESSASPALSVTIDTLAPPAPPTGPDLDESSDSGISDRDDLTNDNTPTIWFVGDNLYRDGLPVPAPPVGILEYTEPLPLPDGTYTYTSRSIDLAGNESGDSAPLVITIDTLAPQAPNAPDMDPGSDSGISNSDNVTNDTTPSLLLPPLPFSLGFITSDSIGAGNDPETVAAGDFNSDGNIDLVTANNDSGDISILRGNGNGTFSKIATIGVGTWASGVDVGDVNGDGNMDIAVAVSASNTVAFLLGNGNGTFRSGGSLSTPSGPERVVLGDLNSDGILDIVSTNYNAGSVSIFLGIGNGAFRSVSTYAVGYQPWSSAVVADLNEDGRKDIAVSNFANFGRGYAWILLGNGDGTFQGPNSYMVGKGAYDIAAGDFNEDGHVDLVVSNEGVAPHTISILLGNGNGAFQPQIVIPTPAVPRDIAVDDFNLDGHQDVAIATSLGASIGLGNGDGTFTGFISFGAGGYPTGLISRDFNGDGKPDLAQLRAGGWDDVQILRNISQADVYYRLFRNGNQVNGDYMIGSSYTEPIPLSDATYVYTLYAVDAAGNVSAPSDPLSITIDTEAPPAPLLELAAVSDTGMSDADGITFDNTPEFEAMLTDAYWRLYVNGSLASRPPILGDDGNVYKVGRVIVDDPIADGNHVVELTSVDAAGNESLPSPPLPLTIDTMAPTGSTPDLDPTTDTGRSDSDDITQGISPLFVGTASDDRSGVWKVVVTSDDGKAGMDTASPFYSVILATLDEGVRRVWATVYDVAGNPFTTLDLPVSVDRTAPTASIPDLNSLSDSGRSDSDDITNAADLKFDGTAGDPAGAGSGIWKVVVTDGDQSAVDESGGNTYSVTLYSTQKGLRSISATVHDIAGNAYTTGALVVTVDRTAPTATTPRLNAISDTGVSDSDNITQGVNPIFGGTADDDLSGIWKVVVASDDGKAGADSASPFYSVMLGALDEGTRSISAMVYDVAGNTFSTDVLVVTVDRTAPSGTKPDLDPSTDSGISDSDDITRSDLLIFRGTASDDRSGIWKVVVSSDDGKWDVDFLAPFYVGTLTGVVEGERAVTTTVYDVAGNVYTTEALAVTVDRTAPSRPEAPDLDDVSDTGFSKTDNITNDTTPTLNLSGYEAYYRLYRNGAQISGDYASVTPYTEATALAKGMYIYNLAAVDAAGNVSAPSDPLAVTIAEEILLRRGKPVVFQDGDGSTITVHLSDCGQATGFMTLTNGETTGASIGLIFLKDTTRNTSLEIHSRQGSVTGTSFEGLFIEKAAGEAGALNMLLARDVSLSPGGRIQADGTIRSITLASIGTGSVVSVVGSVSLLDVAGDIGGLAAPSVIYAVAGIGSLKAGNMTNTLISAGLLGDITILNDLTGSCILSGFDIGADHRLGTGDDGAFSGSTGNIGTITVTGNLVETTIVAGIDPGPDGVFGTADDGVVSSSTIEGAIKALIVKGGIYGPTTVLANGAIGQVKVGGVKLSLPYIFGDIRIIQNWR